MATLKSIIDDVRVNSETGEVLALVSKQGISFHAIDLCEECGKRCKGVDGTGWLLFAGGSITDTLDALAAAVDLGVRTEELPEIGACEALGGIAVCDACFIDDPRENPICPPGQHEFKVIATERSREFLLCRRCGNEGVR